MAHLNLDGLTKNEVILRLTQIITNKDEMIRNLESEVKAKDERIIALREQIERIKECENAK